MANKSIIPEELQQYYDNVKTVYNSKGMYVYPSAIDHLRHEIMKVCNQKVIAETNLVKAKKIIRTLLRLCDDVMTEDTVKALKAEAEQFLEEIKENDNARIIRIF